MAEKINLSLGDLRKIIREEVDRYLSEKCFEDNKPATREENNNKHYPQQKKNKETEIKGILKGETAKALLIEFNGKENWIPKSTIRSWKLDKDVEQKLIIDTWVLEKNKVIAQFF